MTLLDRMIGSTSRVLRRHAKDDVVRALIVADIGISLINPLWAAFAVRRYTGRWSPSLGVPFWIRAWRYVIVRATDRRVDFLSMFQDEGGGPTDKTKSAERADWPAPGSCESCQRCCHNKTASGVDVPCPFLTPKGCSAYGGTLWDYGPCGRFPESPKRVEAYGCPRFEFRSDPSHEKEKRVRLPLVAAQ